MARPYFVNPPKRRKKSRRVRRRAKNGQFIKSIRGRGGRKVSRRAWRKSGYRRNPMARRLPRRSASGRFVKRRSSRRRGRRRNPVYAVNPRRRRRRNPPAFTARGLINTAMEGLAGGAGVTAGKIAVRQGIAIVGVDSNTYVGAAAQGAIGVVARMVLKRFLRGGLGGAFADGVAYGAFNGAFETVFRLLAPDQAAKLLGDTYMLPGLAAYAAPQALLAPPGMAAYDVGVHPALAAAYG